MKGTKRVAVSFGNRFRLGACALALCGLPVAANAQAVATAGDFSGFMAKVTGANSVTVGIGSGGTFYPTTPSASLGGTSGWTTATNFGSGTTASGLTIGQSGTVAVGGKNVPVTLRTPITKAALADGMGILLRNANGLGLALGVALMVADMAKGWDSEQLQANPNPATNKDKPFLIKEGGGYIVWWVTAYPSYARLSSPCNGGPTYPGGDEANKLCATDQGNYSGQFYSRVVQCAQGDVSWNAGQPAPACAQTSSGNWRSANWDEARPKYEAMSVLPSDTLQKQLEWARKQAGQNGIEPYKITTGTPTVISPSPALQPQTKTTTRTRTVTGPDGRPMTIEETITETTTTPITTTGDQVKAEPKTTTTTVTKTTDSDGNQTTKTDTDTTETQTDADPAQDPKESDLCEKYPDILACAKPELDTPDDKIPKRDIQISYDAESVLGGGSCPADKIMMLGGQQVTVWDWQARCQNIVDYVKPVVLALAAFIAMAILLPSLRAEL